jgi:hypothetical protein
VPRRALTRWPAEATLRRQEDLLAKLLTLNLEREAAEDSALAATPLDIDFEDED